MNRLINAPAEIVVDTEHLPDCKPSLSSLLGISVAWSGQPGYYIPVNHWQDVPSSNLVPLLTAAEIVTVSAALASRKLVGWNIEHDREWIDECFNIQSTWSCDARVLWYISDRDQNQVGYSLKTAQKALLGWTASNDKALADDVARSGGRLAKGQHYLARLEVLAEYAGLDAQSTYEIWFKLKEMQNDAAVAYNMQYARLLAKATRRGIQVNELALQKARNYYVSEVKKATTEIRNVCKAEIDYMEAEMLQKRLVGYKRDDSRQKLLDEVKRHPRFNPGSPQQRAALLYDRVGLPVVKRTKTGQPAADKHTIAGFDHPSSKAFVALSHNQKLYQFASSYLAAADGGLIHPPYDTTSTVSERLGGYDPYVLNFPFNSEPIASAFGVRPGYVGVHFDLVSIEPCIIAAWSKDPTLLRIYRDGLGDVYLDLCLDLFPLSEAHHYDKHIESLIRELHERYSPQSPPDSKQKEHFGKLRKVSKIIQLAVGYSGTEYTVARSLTQAGFECDTAKAKKLVWRYWDRFNAVKRLSDALKRQVEERGYINGFYGRKLYVPANKKKDALNRFSQHAGHAVLREIVFRIAKEAPSIGMEPILPDLHDSSSWEAPIEHVEKGMEILRNAVRAESDSLALGVQVRGEFRTFRTFYGLKHDEE